jgi:hypothetical protein
MRNGIEDALVGLYYQHSPERKAEFGAVITGQMRSPKRQDVDAELLRYAAQPLVDAVNDLYGRELSIYVHRMSDGDLWGSNGPVFVCEQLDKWIGQYERAFRLLCELIDAVVQGSNTIAIADAIRFQKS